MWWMKTASPLLIMLALAVISKSNIRVSKITVKLKPTAWTPGWCLVHPDVSRLHQLYIASRYVHTAVYHDRRHQHPPPSTRWCWLCLIHWPHWHIQRCSTCFVIETWVQWLIGLHQNASRLRTGRYICRWCWTIRSFTCVMIDKPVTAYMNQTPHGNIFVTMYSQPVIRIERYMKKTDRQPVVRLERYMKFGTASRRSGYTHRPSV